MSDQRDVVGLIGLGQMGGAMCRTLLRFGWRVMAWEVSPWRSRPPWPTVPSPPRAPRMSPIGRRSC